jgi:hypothetical protein
VDTEVDGADLAGGAGTLMREDGAAAAHAVVVIAENAGAAVTDTHAAHTGAVDSVEAAMAAEAAVVVIVRQVDADVVATGEAGVAGDVA